MKNGHVLLTVFGRSRIAFAACALGLLLHGKCAANTFTLNAFSQMPANNTTLLLSSADPIFGNNGLVSNLAQQGITISNLNGTPLSGVSEYVNTPFAAPASPIAPSGDAIMFTPVLFTFATPVYAVGGTFFDGLTDPNLPDAVFEVAAFGEQGHKEKLIGTAYSSSFTERNGPRAFYVNVGGGEYVASFAGISSNKPINEVMFMLADAMNGPQRGDWSAFSYARTRSVPEPASLLLLGSGFLSLAGFRMFHSRTRLRRFSNRSENLPERLG